ncbi:MAG: hypothetical protein U0174_20145 [Polyangiaceae bacterium]
MRIASTLFAIGLVAACSSTAAPGGGDAGSTDAAADVTTPLDSGTADAKVDGAAPVVTKEEIEFVPKAALPSGESILANSWGDPDAVFAMRPDGSDIADVFQARRVWSFGATRDGSQIAFSSEDPKTEAHYGITTTDSIQNTWLYDLGTKAITFLGPGNVNDECHAFSPDKKVLWVCRRYDFQTDNTFSGWRIGKFDLASGAFSFVTSEDDRFALHPNLLSDGKTLLHGYIDVSVPTKPAYSIVKRSPETGPMTEVRPKAGRPSVSPDGSKYVFTDYANGGRLALANTDGSGSVTEVATQGGDPAWSPDGKKLAITVDDKPNNCQHVDIVGIDPVAAPVRIFDCAQKKRFITNLAWVKVP